jgi:hypothetical protein
MKLTEKFLKSDFFMLIITLVNFLTIVGTFQAATAPHR